MLTISHFIVNNIYCRFAGLLYNIYADQLGVFLSSIAYQITSCVRTLHNCNIIHPQVVIHLIVVEPMTGRWLFKGKVLTIDINRLANSVLSWILLVSTTGLLLYLIFFIACADLQLLRFVLFNIVLAFDSMTLDSLELL